MEFIRSTQTRGPSAAPDLNATLHRSQALNHVVLAEINYFQKEKVRDLKVYLKSLLDEQIDFYEKVNFILVFFIKFKKRIFFVSSRLHQNYVMLYQHLIK